MKKTPSGTSVGVAEPYEHAGPCDHLTGDGRCRLAFERPDRDPAFAEERRDADYRCLVADGDCGWADCPHYRYRGTERECARCGLTERRDAHDGGRPLLEEHHLAYDDDRDVGHEITVSLCRWCHAKVHKSWASIDDDAGPDPEAIAALEERRTRELRELDFETAAERFGDGGGEEGNDG